MAAFGLLDSAIACFGGCGNSVGGSGCKSSGGGGKSSSGGDRGGSSSNATVGGSGSGRKRKASSARSKDKQSNHRPACAKQPQGDFHTRASIEAFCDAASEEDIVNYLNYFGAVSGGNQRSRKAKLILAIHNSEGAKAARAANTKRVELLQMAPDDEHRGEHVYKWFVNEWQLLLRSSRTR